MAIQSLLQRDTTISPTARLPSPLQYLFALATAHAECRQKHRPFINLLTFLSAVQVDLYDSGTIAIVEAVSPELGNRVQRVRVQLPGTSPELLNKFRDKKVDFAAHTATEDGGAVFLNLIGNLAFPLLLVGGLFLLSRRSQVWPSFFCFWRGFDYVVRVLCCSLALPGM